MATGNVSSNDTFLEKSSKLIPGEAMGVYFALCSVGLQGMDDERRAWLTLAAALVVGLAAVPFLLKYQKVTSIRQYVLSVVAFFLWVFNAQYERLPTFTDDHTFATAVGAFLLILFTFFAPRIASMGEPTK